MSIPCSSESGEALHLLLPLVKHTLRAADAAMPLSPVSALKSHTLRSSAVSQRVGVLRLMARHLINPMWLEGMHIDGEEEDNDNAICLRGGRRTRQRSWEDSHRMYVLDSQAAIARNWPPSAAAMAAPCTHVKFWVSGFGMCLFQGYHNTVIHSILDGCRLLCQPLTIEAFPQLCRAAKLSTAGSSRVPQICPA